MFIIALCFFGAALAVLLAFAAFSHFHYLRITAEVPTRSIFRSPIRLHFSNHHWWYSYWFKQWGSERDYCSHSPQAWPWWRLVTFKSVRIDMATPSIGWRLWAYTRWGALYWDLTMDRRLK